MFYLRVFFTLPILFNLLRTGTIPLRILKRGKNTTLFYLTGLVSGSLLLPVYGQMEHGGWPASANHPLKGNVPVVTFPAVSKTMLRANNELLVKPLQFAIPFDGDWNPENSGVWTQDEKYLIWRCGFMVPDALSVGIIFTQFDIPEGASVYLYTQEYQRIAGAYTRDNVLPSRQLALLPLPGDLCYVEYNVPAGLYRTGQISVGRVAGGVIDILGLPEKDYAYNAVSGACEVDINCTEGDSWQREKRGVVKLVINGTTLCTGTLINNTGIDGKPYLLTAGHCITDQDDAWRTVCTFDYERSSCGSGTVNTSQTISGAELISTVSGLDFSLVQLTVPPPPSYNPLYLGWDLDTIGISSTVTIHHPAGDVKKISVDTDAPIKGNFGGGYDYMSHWRILRWETGATEGGSSGAPLFSQKHRIIGTLTGGDATCSNPVNDYFQRFDRCWDDYETVGNQLRAWLDPANSGKTFLDHFDPYNYLINNCDTLTNIAVGEKIGLKSLQFGGYSSGHNWLGINGYAEQFYLPDSATITGVILFPARLYDRSSTDGSYITIFIATGNLTSGNRIYSEKILFSALKANQPNFIPLWHSLSAKDTLYAGYEIYYGTQDTFALAQTLDRLPGAINTAYVWYGGVWSPYESVFSLPASLSIGLQVCDITWLKTGRNQPRIARIGIYPVPSTGELTLDFEKTYNGHAQVHIYDLAGRLVWSTSIMVQGSQNSFSAGFLENGIYILKLILSGNSVYSTRFVIQK